MKQTRFSVLDFKGDRRLIEIPDYVYHLSQVVDLTAGTGDLDDEYYVGIYNVLENYYTQLAQEVFNPDAECIAFLNTSLNVVNYCEIDIVTSPW